MQSYRGHDRMVLAAQTTKLVTEMMRGKELTLDQLDHIVDCLETALTVVKDVRIAEHYAILREENPHE